MPIIKSILSTLSRHTRDIPRTTNTLISTDCITYRLQGIRKLSDYQLLDMVDTLNDRYPYHQFIIQQPVATMQKQQPNSYSPKQEIVYPEELIVTVV